MPAIEYQGRTLSVKKETSQYTGMAYTDMDDVLNFPVRRENFTTSDVIFNQVIEELFSRVDQQALLRQIQQQLQNQGLLPSNIESGTIGMRFCAGLEELQRRYKEKTLFEMTEKFKVVFAKSNIDGDELFKSAASKSTSDYLSEALKKIKQAYGKERVQEYSTFAEQLEEELKTAIGVSCGFPTKSLSDIYAVLRKVKSHATNLKTKVIEQMSAAADTVIAEVDCQAMLEQCYAQTHTAATQHFSTKNLEDALSGAMPIDDATQAAQAKLDNMIKAALRLSFHQKNSRFQLQKFCELGVFYDTDGAMVLDSKNERGIEFTIPQRDLLLWLGEIPGLTWCPGTQRLVMRFNADNLDLKSSDRSTSMSGLSYADYYTNAIGSADHLAKFPGFGLYAKAKSEELAAALLQNLKESFNQAYQPQTLALCADLGKQLAAFPNMPLDGVVPYLHKYLEMTEIFKQEEPALSESLNKAKDSLQQLYLHAYAMVDAEKSGIVDKQWLATIGSVAKNQAVLALDASGHYELGRIKKLLEAQPATNYLKLFDYFVTYDSWLEKLMQDKQQENLAEAKVALDKLNEMAKFLILQGVLLKKREDFKDIVDVKKAFSALEGLTCKQFSVVHQFAATRLPGFAGVLSDKTAKSILSYDANYLQIFLAYFRPHKQGEVLQHNEQTYYYALLNQHLLHIDGLLLVDAATREQRKPQIQDHLDQVGVPNGVDAKAIQQLINHDELDLAYREFYGRYTADKTNGDKYCIHQAYQRLYPGEVADFSLIDDKDSYGPVIRQNGGKFVHGNVKYHWGKGCTATAERSVFSMLSAEMTTYHIEHILVHTPPMLLLAHMLKQPMPQAQHDLHAKMLETMVNSNINHPLIDHAIYALNQQELEQIQAVQDFNTMVVARFCELQGSANAIVANRFTVQLFNHFVSEVVPHLPKAIMDQLKQAEGQRPQHKNVKTFLLARLLRAMLGHAKLGVDEAKLANVVAVLAQCGVDAGQHAYAQSEALMSQDLRCHLNSMVDSKNVFQVWRQEVCVQHKFEGFDENIEVHYLESRTAYSIQTGYADGSEVDLASAYEACDPYAHLFKLDKQNHAQALTAVADFVDKEPHFAGSHEHKSKVLAMLNEDDRVVICSEQEIVSALGVGYQEADEAEPIVKANIVYQKENERLQLKLEGAVAYQPRSEARVQQLNQLYGGDPVIRVGDSDALLTVREHLQDHTKDKGKVVGAVYRALATRLYIERGELTTLDKIQLAAPLYETEFVQATAKEKGGYSPTVLAGDEAAIAKINIEPQAFDIYDKPQSSNFWSYYAGIATPVAVLVAAFYQPDIKDTFFVTFFSEAVDDLMRNTVIPLMQVGLALTGAWSIYFILELCKTVYTFLTDACKPEEAKRLQDYRTAHSDKTGLSLAQAYANRLLGSKASDDHRTNFFEHLMQINSWCSSPYPGQEPQSFAAMKQTLNDMQQAKYVPPYTRKERNFAVGFDSVRKIVLPLAALIVLSLYAKAAVEKIQDSEVIQTTASPLLKYMLKLGGVTGTPDMAFLALSVLSLFYTVFTAQNLVHAWRWTQPWLQSAASAVSGCLPSFGNFSCEGLRSCCASFFSSEASNGLNDPLIKEYEQENMGLKKLEEGVAKFDNI